MCDNNLINILFAGVIKALDESVGRTVKALSDADLLKNSVIIFTSDNGGSTAVQPFANSASNYPLRGVGTIYARLSYVLLK